MLVGIIRDAFLSRWCFFVSRKYKLGVHLMRFSRVWWLVGVFAFVLPVMVASSASGKPRQMLARPNILLIVVDDLGWSDLGCYGADLNETPNIDRLARGAVRFTDAYAAAPVCSPTRASIMTGKYPARLHMTIWFEASGHPPISRRLIPPKTIGNLPHEEVTLAEKLKPLGYLTAHVGKWHLGDAAHYPQTQGFDLNIGGTFWGAPPTYFYPYRGNWSRTTEFRYVPHLEFGHEGEYLTDRLTDEALRIMEYAAGKPFFLHLAYHSVHTPIEAKRPVVEKYASKLQSGLHHKNPTYAAMVESVDQNVARVLKKLDTLGIADQTIVMLTSYNGGFVNQHRGLQVTDNAPLRSGKGSLYEGGLRVPLIIRWPGVTPRRGVCHVPVVSTDLHATIVDMVQGDAAGAKSGAVDGLTLVPLLRDPRAKLAREAIYFHYPHYYPTTTPVSAVRAGDWKLLEYFEDLHVELYHVSNDLGEHEDLSARMPRRAAELRRRLHDWRASIAAQMPVPNANYRAEAQSR